MAQQGNIIDPVPAPPLNIPSSSHTCDLYAVDATTDIVCPSGTLMEPVIPGHEKLNLPTFAFYIVNKQLNKHILFDNGARKDWWNAPPATAAGIGRTVGVRIADDVYDVLAAGGADPDSITAVVWSHWHWDHVGNIQRFPKTTSVVVGPGFRETFLPGYPEREDALFHSADFEERELIELEFSSAAPKIGRFLAHDYFGDGSFYVLFTPGHTAGHVSGLVRTTPDTFVFLGGDISHFPGMYRPTKYAPMPDPLPAETVLDARFQHPCPCSIFTACHPDPSNARTSTFNRPSAMEGSWYEDVGMAQDAVFGLQEFDGSENVFVAIAHDPALREVVEHFPRGKMNEWKRKGWGRRSHWHFVNELPVDGKPGREILVDGIYKEGQKIS